MSDAHPESRMPQVAVDSAALAANWRLLARRAPGSRTGAAVKANGYGLGAAEAADVLQRAGCRDFFVAWCAEGVALRASLGDRPARIFVLQGLDAASVSAMSAADLVPVLSTPDDVALWREAGRRDGVPLPAALQVESGMNRLGLDPADAAHAAGLVAEGSLSLDIVMSHLASADEPGDQSERQLAVFRRVAALFPDVPLSLANSTGILRGPDFHFDLTRPGIALYGGGDAGGCAGLSPVATLTAAVLQLRTGANGEAAGYGAAARLTRETRIATVGLGYADGFLRAGSGAGVPAPADRPAPAAFLDGRLVAILGRISMDLTLLDVTDVPANAIAPGSRVEFFGPNLSIDRVAASAGTIAYEFLTSLGPRVARRWIP